MTNDPDTPKKILFTTSTMPSSDTDPVPAFVKNEAIWFKKLYPELSISVLAPHNAYGNTKNYSRHKYYDEYRFHYFWPYKWEKLTGKGIQPALKKNKFLYVQLPTLFIAELFATWKYVRKHKPDLIYAHWFTPQALTGAVVSKITKVPLVFDTQASDAIVLKHVPFSKKIVAWVCRQALSYTVPSRQTLDKLLYFTTDKNRDEILDKVTMVPYGTSSEEVSDKVVQAARDKYNLNGKRVIYFIGRLVDRKGVDLLIKAFNRMENSDDSLRLVIVGDGQDRKELEALTKKLNLQNSVIFTGFITGNERYALLKLADVCAIPSINVGDQSEGLPVVFMEAATFNKAIVLSDATGAHEVAEDSKNAFIVKAGSVDELVHGLDKALSISRKEDEQFYVAVEKLAKEFQWPRIAKKRYDALVANNYKI